MSNPEAIGYVVIGISALLGIIGYYHANIIKPAQVDREQTLKSLHDINMNLSSLSLRFDRSTLDLGDLAIQMADMRSRIDRLERQFEVASARETTRVQD